MQRLFFTAIILAALQSLSGASVKAGPDDVANWLMEDSVSMLDWGNFRLEAYLNQKARSGSPEVTYNWDRNLIEIRGNEFTNDVDHEFDDEACRKWVDDIRIEAFVVPSEGQVLRGFDNSRFANFYKHSGFYRQSQGKTQDEIMNGLDQLFHIRFTTWRKQSDSVSYVISGGCSGFLLSNRISIEK